LLAVPVPLPSGHRLGYEDIHSTEKKSNGHDGCNWKTKTGDLAMWSHSHQRMQETTNEVFMSGPKFAKVLKINAASTEPVTLEGNEIEWTDTFTYWGRTTDKQVGTGTDWPCERSILYNSRTSGAL